MEQTRIGGPVTHEKKQGKRITDPSAYVKPEKAILMYAANTTENQRKAYYETEGMHLPNLEMKSKIEKLEILEDARSQVNQKRNKLREMDEKASGMEKDYLTKKNANKDVSEDQQSRPPGAGQNQGKS